ncbi:AAA family ATPase [Aestuariicella sp. G3-2]|uniref:AAA domain-containing protein n=1 Tax=Pseudomaricurvus albidus TaxID=2842452 RepID=UPI001C0DA696|nr:AAA domain-containing protein [Aestuariicella albida]MBU3070217.1 AAA family ATPase [Aestuariicella albida]
MDVEVWDGGLQEQEISAIEKIKTAFSNVQNIAQLPAKKSKAGSFKDALQAIGCSDNRMFPWKGYAGFRFVSSKGQEGEFDLIIVTHSNVLIIELKDWNHAPVTAENGRWYKGGKDMGRSPVSVTQNKVFTLKGKLEKIKHRFTNKNFVPFIEFFVVMTGDADFSQLPEVDRKHTLSLDQFLQFANKDVYEQHLRPNRHPKANQLNEDFHLFDELFIGRATEAKKLRIGGYEAKEEIFVHPKSVYREYLAGSEISPDSEALLRVWDFNKVEGKGQTPSGRADVVSRERQVLEHIRHQNHDLYNHCLRSLTSFQKDELTTHYSEVYELPPSHERFNQFIGKFGEALDQRDRLSLVKLLVAKFGDLHDIKVAHRDIADHSLWISPTNEISLSNFISAYHQPIGTVGDYRQKLSVGAIEAEDMLDGRVLSPFEQDVHSLALVAWHLLSAQRMSPKSCKNLQNDLESCSEWYGEVLLSAANAKFRTAREFFDAFKRAEPVVDEIPTFDDGELEQYRQSISHQRQYREDDDFIKETAEKEVYLSNGCLVKAWLNCGYSGGNPTVNFQVYSFLQRLDKLRSVQPNYLPAIREYGIASKSSSLYLVTDYIQGSTWGEIEGDKEAKLTLIGQLIAAVEHLHELGIAHGDLHPANVMIEEDTSALFLIDMPDFSLSSDEPKNHRYSPENIDNSTAFDRDNFAVMRMAAELLGIEWGEGSDEFINLTNAIEVELKDQQFGFKDLGRFKQAIMVKGNANEQESIDITASSADSQITILPDNGRIYLQIERSKKNPSDALVTFHGIGGSVAAFYQAESKAFVHALKPRVRASVDFRDAEKSQFEISTAIRITPGAYNDLGSLSKLMSYEELFHGLVEETIAPDETIAQKEEASDAALTEELRLAFEKTLSPIEKQQARKLQQLPTAKLWRAILETETQSHPNVYLDGDSVEVPGRKGELRLPYAGDADPLGAFSQSDEVEALLVDDEGGERFLGKVLLKKSALGEVRLTDLRPTARRLSEGDTVYFRSKQDRASYRKRKAALQKLLDCEGVMPELMQLFDSDCTRAATQYGLPLTKDDFSRYDRMDAQGNKISLNVQQRSAFSKLLNHGPLSLLQGPPGTGKTEFIAAFVHHLIEAQGARRILLVSQSHEAVNTAAERIRKHCKRLKTELEVVRFSNREAAVSTGLKDVYSQAITSQKRELFNAERKYRVENLSDALGLEPEFISSIVLAELDLFQKIDHLEKLMHQFSSETEGDDKEDLDKLIQELRLTISDSLINDYEVELKQDMAPRDAKDQLVHKLCLDYAVTPSEARKVRALAKISCDMQSALRGERVNYDEFYARSRQLVTGTCVGIGQGHIGIHNNVYDWVIIDEAARSISSELAIAMQSAKRVLLVGDHLQLPPLYSETHKQALAKKLGLSADRSDLDEILQSDFARAFNSDYGRQASAALLTQYRMADPIGNLVSATFYDGKLENGDREVPDIYWGVPEVLNSTVTWLDTSPLGGRANHIEGKGKSILNPCEADQIISILKKIAADEELVNRLSSVVGENEAAIGVICMYGEQKRHVRQKFSQEVWAESFKSLVKIDTVDSYQGKENRIIILTLTRSDGDYTPGFLRTPNRINVAMSRAMDRLLIVGNSAMWRSGNNKELPLGAVINYMEEQGPKAGFQFVNAKHGGVQ